MNIKQKIYTIIFFLLSYSSNSQVIVPPSPVKWYTFSQAVELNKKVPKQFFIDFHTEWCGWCKQMMATTFKDPQVANYLNAYFYPVRFDAETHDTIIYLDTLYINKSKTGRIAHDLAAKLLQGNLTYPTVMFMDKDLKPITLIPGYRTVEELLPILIFFNEEVYLSGITFFDFDKYFKQTYPRDQRGQYTVTKSNVKWLTLDEALKLNAKNPKKIFIDIYVDWRIGCNMMYLTTYNNSKVAEYLNDKFYPVRLNAITRDTLTFGEKYYNTGKDPSYHSLVMAMLQGNMKFPVSLYLDENNKLLDVVPSYLTPESLEPILTYFGDNIYKKAKWPDFRGNFKTKFFAENNKTIDLKPK